MIYPRPVPAPRGAVIGASFVLASCLLAGCSASPTTVSRLLAERGSSLSFSFTSESGSDYIDQVLNIENESGGAVAPVLSFVALDHDGDPLPDVKVFTAFGSDTGRLVVPPGHGWDVLEFLGAGSQDVADVRVGVVKTQPVGYPRVERDPEAVVLDDDGTEGDSSSMFASVSVTNDNDQPIQVRLAYLIWEEDRPGSPQQFTVSQPIGDLITVPANGSAQTQVDYAALGTMYTYADRAPASVLPYYSH
jgi:hypothetical protein